MIGDTMYALSGWLWEIHVHEHIKKFVVLRDMHIMHWDGLFMGGPEALGEPTL